ncbi:MAG: ABC transporter substrate-binding protein [Deltaproteobacteria bacterium]|nr:ABC transporter substrate-binding protein [Deltaproteobacteria bacterium]
MAVVLCSFLVTALAAFEVSRAKALAAPAPPAVVIGYPSPTPRIVPLLIAQEQDFFGKYGAAAEPVFVRNSQILIAGLAANNIHIGYTGGTTVLGAAAGGVELKMLAGFVNRQRSYLVVRSEIKTPGDLAGKRFGVQSIGGTNWMHAMLALKQLKLDPARDQIRILVIGDQTVLSQALEAGVIDASVFTSRTLSVGLNKKGFPALAELTPSVAATGIVAKKSYLEKDSHTLERVIKAFMEGLVFALTPGNKPYVLKTIMRRLKISDPALAEEGYADVAGHFESRRPYPSLDGLRNMQQLMRAQNPRLADIKLDDLVDNTFVRNLEESGFIAQLHLRHEQGK